MDQIIESNSVLTPPTPMSSSGPTVPIGAKIIAVLFYIVSIVFIFLGILLTFVGSISFQAFGSLGLRAGLVPGIEAVAWGVFNFFTGRGLWLGKQWGKILAITISALYIIFGIIGIVMFGRADYISLAINIVIVLYILLSKDVKTSFQGRSSSKSIIAAVLAILVYVAMQFPALFGSSQNPIMITTQDIKNLQNSTPTDAVKSMTPPGVYSNTAYGFEMNIPFAYISKEQQRNDGYFAFISDAQPARILISVSPTTLSVRDAINKDLNSGVTASDVLIDTNLGGEPAIEDTSAPSDRYFVVHNGNYYRFSHYGPSKNNIEITDEQFKSAVQSLRFTK